MCRPPTRTVTAGLLTLCFSLILLEVVAERISLTPGTPGATPELPATLPSTTAVAPDEIEAGLPLLSVVLEPVDLYDPVTGMLEDDEEYRRYFKRAFAHMLNHQLTPDFLSAQFDHYADIARTHGISDLRYLDPIQEFLTTRPDTLLGVHDQTVEDGRPAHVHDPRARGRCPHRWRARHG